MITDSKLWKEIQEENIRLTALIDENNGEINLNEIYIESPTFNDFARHFEDADKAMMWWNELGNKYAN